ncbi:trehalose-6-phosphate synthase [Halobium salinum]|uniref:Trehalose-6-phosphate synthase n=1 Tax=Halobium salinum TaxID=1364940 RepID=A0ABD5PFS5_9EURY|nr:trehalose-6-phosphate synthase [Halobium salinum]
MATDPNGAVPNVEGPDAETGVAGALDDLVVVSNREPYQHRYTEEAGVVVDTPVGGLTGGLDRVMRRTDGTWIAWGDSDADPSVVNAADCVRVPPGDPSYTLRRVWLGEDAVREYYYGFSNQVLWPLCHGLHGKAEFDRAFWERYRDVNAHFAETVAEHVEPGSTVWFQDYHLALAPRMVRQSLPAGTPLVQFWHIPWPEADTFRACPEGEALLDGLLGTDVLGFHVPEYCRNFLDCVARELPGATVDRDAGEVVYDGHRTRVRAFPMGVDAERIGDVSANTPDGFWESFRREHGVVGSTVAVGVDRLDYTKGIPERLDALERFWERNPEWRGELTYVQKATESRSAIPAYQRLGTEVRDGVERVNDRFGTDEWTPVVYLEEHLSDADLYGLYRHSDLALVTPVRDGMNLVAKEYVAAQPTTPGEAGVLLLSALAGADDDLGDDALTVHPSDTDGFADAIGEAVSMPDHDRDRRMCRLRSTVRTNDLDAWMGDVFAAVEGVRDGVGSVGTGDTAD